MQALVQSVESVVAAMACAAFAHFGVALKAPCPKAHEEVHRIPISSTVAPQRARPNATDVLSKDQRRA
jgi:hypothetical protein